MKITKPAEMVEVCDRCQCAGYLETCIVCGKQYCLSCRGMIAGCWVSPDICRSCAEREDVITVVKTSATMITPIIQNRDKKLRCLPPNG